MKLFFLHSRSVSAISLLFALSMLCQLGCGSETSPEPFSPSSSELEAQKVDLEATLPELEKPKQSVIVVPWKAVTNDRYLEFKVHRYDAEKNALTVSTFEPGSSWTYSPPKAIVFSKTEFLRDEKNSSTIVDVFAKYKEKTTYVTKGTGRRKTKTYSYPYRLEIRLYKNINGEYTGECDYSMQYFRPKMFGGLKKYKDLAINQACPIHTI